MRDQGGWLRNFEMIRLAGLPTPINANDSPTRLTHRLAGKLKLMASEGCGKRWSGQFGLLTLTDLAAQPGSMAAGRATWSVSYYLRAPFQSSRNDNFCSPERRSHLAARHSSISRLARSDLHSSPNLLASICDSPRLMNANPA